MEHPLTLLETIAQEINDKLPNNPPPQHLSTLGPASGGRCSRFTESVMS